MRKARWSTRASDQFENILAYAAQFDIRSADRIADAVEEAVAALCRRPTGRPWPEAGAFVKLVAGTRYLVVYRLGDGPEGDVRILRVYHSAQNWTTDPLNDL